MVSEGATSAVARTPRIFFTPSRLLLLAMNVVIYAFLLRWVAHNIDFSRLLSYLERIPPWAVLASLAFNVASLCFYGLRMAMLLGRGIAVSFAVINIGYALNTVLPLRVGDAVQVYLCHRLYDIKLTDLLGASVAEKILDLGKPLLLGGLLVVLSAGAFVNAGILAPLAAAVFGALGAALLFRLYLARFVHLLPKRGGLRRGVISLHRQMRNYRILRILLVTVTIWSFNIGLMYLTFNLYLPAIHFGILDAIALLVITSLAVAVPFAPAGLGLFEAGIVAYLHQKIGVGNEAALAVASVFHVVITMPQCLLALLFVHFREQHGTAR